MEGIDSLLSELAATCPFSSSGIRTSNACHRNRRDILRDLYRSATPASASVITQIILKDLRPLLYPLREAHYRAQLLQYNSRAVRMLTKEEAVWAWFPSGKMAGALRTRASLGEAAQALDESDIPARPRVGVMIAVRPFTASMITGRR